MIAVDRDQLSTYWCALYGAEPSDSLVEVRYRLPSRRGMGQRFYDVLDSVPAIAGILELGRQTDVYVGVAPRCERSGGRDAIERVHVAWADCDEPESIDALASFKPAPSLIITSGRGQHAYWSLWPPVGPDAIERANRRLAHALGADSAATDAARILRPPGTFNHKRDEPRPVGLEHVEVECYTLAEIVGELADPDEPDRLVGQDGGDRPPAIGTQRGHGPGDDVSAALATIAPPEYVERLSGRPVGRDGKARCPFHAGGQERTPSLHAYAEPEGGWTCYGCPPDPAGKRNGGTIFDFAAQLWGIEPRGDGFRELRDRLAAELLDSPPVLNSAQGSHAKKAAAQPHRDGSAEFSQTNDGERATAEAGKRALGEAA